VATVEVRYVNGTLIGAQAGAWASLRGDGVDYVDLRHGEQTYRIQGRSVYWLHREDGLWVAGGGTVTDVVEVVASPDGFDVRHPEHMPDVVADQAKWGWWER
jgi:hypothetical protein